MQLNDILEENSVKSISLKTKISEDNLENLFANKFEKLRKVKTLGFISILEREYGVDLSALREEAQEYYEGLEDDKSITLGLPIMEEKKGISKFFLFVVLLLFGYATWYFLTQFDKKHLRELIPFIDEATIESFVGHDESKEDVAADLNIAKISQKKETAITTVEEIIVSKETVAIPTDANSSTDDAKVEITQTVTDITPSVETAVDPMSKEIVSIVPVNRIWFGLVNKDTKKRSNFSISEPYDLNVSNTSWLLATSSAPFSLLGTDENKTFSDAKEHYFEINKDGIESLSKNEYVALGGWAKW